MARTARAQIRLKVTKPWSRVVVAIPATTMPKHCMIRDVEDEFEVESDLSAIPDAAAVTMREELRTRLLQDKRFDHLCLFLTCQLYAMLRRERLKRTLQPRAVSTTGRWGNGPGPHRKCLLQ
jgi:hypothetical protein